MSAADPSSLHDPSSFHDRGPFHEGELAVQERAGLRTEASRLIRMLARGVLTDGMRAFIADQPLVFLTARDGAGVLWTSAITGPPGFITAEPGALTIGALPPPGDPLHAVAAGGSAGLLFIEFARRRRLRVNGALRVVDGTGITVDVRQAYGNCPQYIHPEPAAMANCDVARADTFILGTSHPLHGPDTSHRGGPAGFVRRDGDRLWWPDYPGNHVFNSLGNIEVDPAASLLFWNADGGTSLQLTGTAVIDWSCPDVRDGEPASGRRVCFTPARQAAVAAPPPRH